MQMTAKDALTRALPEIKHPETKAHVAKIVTTDLGDLALEVPEGLIGDDLAEYVFSAFPSLGHTFSQPNDNASRR